MVQPAGGQVYKSYNWHGVSPMSADLHWVRSIGVNTCFGSGVEKKAKSRSQQLCSGMVNKTKSRGRGHYLAMIKGESRHQVARWEMPLMHGRVTIITKMDSIISKKTLSTNGR